MCACGLCVCGACGCVSVAWGLGTFFSSFPLSFLVARERLCYLILRLPASLLAQPNLQIPNLIPIPITLSSNPNRHNPPGQPNQPSQLFAQSNLIGQQSQSASKANQPTNQRSSQPASQPASFSSQPAIPAIPRRLPTYCYYQQNLALQLLPLYRL